MRHKYEVLCKALENYHANSQQPIAYFGDFEMVTAIGAILRAAELHLIILID